MFVVSYVKVLLVWSGGGKVTVSQCPGQVLLYFLWFWCFLRASKPVGRSVCLPGSGSGGAGGCDRGGGVVQVWPNEAKAVKAARAVEIAGR